MEHGFHLVLFCIGNVLYLLENRRVEQMTSESILEALADKRLLSLSNFGSAWEIKYQAQGDICQFKDSDFDRLVQRWIDLLQQWDSVGIDKCIVCGCMISEDEVEAEGWHFIENWEGELCKKCFDNDAIIAEFLFHNKSL
jgi:hypothetical protein